MSSLMVLVLWGTMTIAPSLCPLKFSDSEATGPPGSISTRSLSRGGFLRVPGPAGSFHCLHLCIGNYLSTLSTRENRQ